MMLDPLSVRYWWDLEKGQDRAEYVVGFICAVVVVAVALLGDGFFARLGTLAAAVEAWLASGAV
jgi:hypothetical protein